jgi:hypothetical protein
VVNDTPTEGTRRKSGAHYRQEIGATEIGCTCISPVPRDVAKNANKSVTDVYSKLKEDVTFRKKVVEQVGIGFELEPAPNCTQTVLLSNIS